MNSVKALERMYIKYSKEYLRWVRLLGLMGLALYCAACSATTVSPTATAPLPPSETPIPFPTLPPSHTPTATFTATATQPVTATATSTATLEPTQTSEPITPIPTTAVAPTEPVALGGPNKIVFASNRSGENRLYVINPDGSGQGLVLASNEAQIDPAWSPDRDQIAFASGDTNFHLFILDVETRVVTQLTAGDSSDTDPTWSPRGDQLAYISSTLQDNNQSVAELRIFDLEAGTSRVVVSGVAPQPQLNHISWSPDGRLIAFTAFVDNQTEIHVIKVDGTDEENLTTEGPSYNPDWSPDGRRIAFVSGRTGQTEVYSMAADGSDVRKLNGGGLAAILTVAWSPNGKQLVFNGGASNASELYIMNADGTELYVLTNVPKADHSPDW